MTQNAKASTLPVGLTLDDIAAVSPSLANYGQSTLVGDLWKRAGLSPRDRSIVTVAAFITRNQPIDLPYHLNLALNNGVSAAEISELITHLAFYAGWANALAAVAVARPIFEARGITRDQLPAVKVEYLPLDTQAEATRAANVERDIGPASESLVHYTGAALFNDLWLRPDLAPRDRSLVTVAALISAGQVVQIPFHLKRAMTNGLTRAEASEVLGHLAFYAGWPNAMSAAPIVRKVFEELAAQETMS